MSEAKEPFMLPLHQSVVWVCTDNPFKEGPRRLSVFRQSNHGETHATPTPFEELATGEYRERMSRESGEPSFSSSTSLCCGNMYMMRLGKFSICRPNHYEENVSICSDLCASILMSFEIEGIENLLTLGMTKSVSIRVSAWQSFRASPSNKRESCVSRISWTIWRM